MTVQTTSPTSALLLLKLRLAVARHGEMDGAGWWNTRGILGRVGKAGLSRGFPSTHYFAQARVAFTVAAARSAEVFSPPACYTLWNLPPVIEESLNSQWQAWCRDPEAIIPLFETVSNSGNLPLLELLDALNAIDDVTRTALRDLKLTAQGKAVQLLGIGYPDDAALLLLAAAFSLGSKGSLAVPYLRAE